MTRSVIQLGGQALKLDADGDSSIQASTDDTVVIKANNTTAMTIDSSGDTTVSNNLKSNGGYELIQSKMSTSHNGLAGGSVIEFRNVFSNAYIAYKVIVGWYLHAGDSGENVEVRFMTGTNTQQTASQYRYAVNRVGSEGTDTILAAINQTKGVIFTTVGGETNGANVGIHGEFNIINVGNTTLGGVDTQRFYSDDSTPVYAPFMYGTMVGYSIQGSEYERQDFFVRFNTAENPYTNTGFCFLTPSSGEAKGTHIAVYGLRSA